MKYITEKNSKVPILSIMLTGGILLYLVLIFIANVFHYSYILNADIASDAVLSSLIWDSGQLCPKSWYTAMELRIICTPNVSALFYGITHNPALAMGLGCFTMTILILLSIYYFMSVLEVKRSNRLWMLFLCLALPTGFGMLELLYLYASYYAVHAIILFVTLGIYAEALKKKEYPVFMMLKMAAAMLLSFILGMQGVRGILVIYGPLFGIEFIRNIYIRFRRKKPEKADYYLAGWVCLLLVAGFAGTLQPGSVGQNPSRNIRQGFSKLFLAVLPDALRAIGFQNTGWVGQACLVILMTAAVLTLGGILFQMLKKKEIEISAWPYLVIWSSPIVTALLVAFTTMESTERYYFIFIFVMAFSLTLLMQRADKRVKIIIGLAAFVLAGLNVCKVYAPILKSREPAPSDMYETVRYLEENNYDTAYATFENANTMTVLSGNEVRVAPVASVSEMDICKWMSSTEWYVPNQPYAHPIVYIVTDNEMKGFQTFYEKHKEELSEIKQIGKYHLYAADYNFSNLGDE